MTDRQEFVQPDSNNLHLDDAQHIRLTYVIHYYLNQKTRDTVEDLLKTYEGYSDTLLDQIQFVIVDDCSPLQFDIPDLNLNYTWLRITTDIPWNQGGGKEFRCDLCKVR